MKQVATFRLSTYFILFIIGLLLGTVISRAGEVTWYDSASALPAGATCFGSDSPSLHERYFNYAAEPLRVARGDSLFARVYLDAAHPPAEIMVEWNAGTWEHRAYWGANALAYGKVGTCGHRYMGPLPSPGRWVELRIPASAVGLERASCQGLGFSAWGGEAKCGRAGLLPRGANAADAANFAWVKGAVPAGAEALSDGDAWIWVNGAHRSALAAGLHEHFFNYAAATMSVGAEDTLYTSVYLDPAHPPSEIMLSWNDGTWEHRAYWGADRIGYGAPHTPGRAYMGPLPAAGRWVQLRVPASAVALSGETVSGMGFTCFGGQATWSASGDLTAETGLAERSASASRGTVAFQGGITGSATN